MLEKKTHFNFFDHSNNCGATEMDGSISSKLDGSFYNVFVTKSGSRKIGALICSMKLFSCEVALYFYKSTIELHGILPVLHRILRSCFFGAPSSNLDILDKLVVVLHLLFFVNP